MLPTPARGWTIADQVRHLATSERAAALALAGRSHEVFGPDATVRAPLSDEPGGVLEAWRSARSETLVALAGRADRDRVVWGAGPMSTRSFADARLMETWAHGLDCFAAVGQVPIDTNRIRRVADLAWRALPYAFRVAGEEPAGDLRTLGLDLRGPDGDAWWIGPPTAMDTISGRAGDWCRVAVRRLAPGDASLRAVGPLAGASLRVARAYLDDA